MFAMACIDRQNEIDKKKKEKMEKERKRQEEKRLRKLQLQEQGAEGMTQAGWLQWIVNKWHALTGSSS